MACTHLAPGNRRHRIRLGLWLASLWLGAMATSTCAGRAFFTFPLEGSASPWAAGVVPTTLEPQDLAAVRVQEQLVFRQQGIDALDLHGLKPRQVGLLMEAPTASPNFSFLRKVRVVAEGDGLPVVDIASGEQLAGGTNYVGLDVADVDLTAYARKGPIRISGVVEAADAPLADTTVRLVLDMEAWVAQPGAACWQK